MVADGWQPIETAPLSTVVLLAVDSGDEQRVFPGYLSHDSLRQEWYWLVAVSPGWENLHYTWAPSHWRHLPPPPTETTEAKQQRNFSRLLP
jgi:hypothetical protein